MFFESQSLICNPALKLTARRNFKAGKGVFSHVTQFRVPQLASDIEWLKLNIPLLLSHCHPLKVSPVLEEVEQATSCELYSTGVCRIMIPFVENADRLC